VSCSLPDLSSAVILVGPVAGANHFPWQFGHLIEPGALLMRPYFPNAAYPVLPAGFAAQLAAGMCA